tara:strand:+ start:1327 stop:1788 length:462 start_codon:yes stop_codon:yes gene_type:complete
MKCGETSRFVAREALNGATTLGGGIGRSMHATYSNILKDEDRARSAVADICGETVQLLMVADGHGGKQVAELCAEHAFTYLVREATAAGDGGAASLQGALTRTFEQLHTSAVAFSKKAGTQLRVEKRLWDVAWPAAWPSSPHGSKGRAAPSHS